MSTIPCRLLLWRIVVVVCAAGCLTSAGRVVHAGADAEEKTKSADQKTHTVEKGPFQIEVSFDGVFEADKMHEVTVRPEEWSQLKVEEAVEHGTAISQGQTLVRFETEKLDKQIRELEYARKLSAIALEQAEKQLGYLKESLPLDLESAERSRKVAEDELEFFLNIDKELQKESAERSLESAHYSLEYAQEELDQLEKMYKADDLTEETEEIILKRARRRVDMAKFSLKRTKIRTERTLETRIPREEERLQETARRARLNWQKAQATLPAQVREQELELAKLRFERKQSDERYARLRQDRKKLTVESPAEGTVYYGRCDRGQWSGMETTAKQLRPGGNVTPNQVFLTVVQKRPVFVRAEVEEKHLADVRDGVSGRVAPKAFPDEPLPAAVAHVSAIPVIPGKFDCRIEVELDGEHAEAIVPGMTCTVKLVSYRNEDALTVPASAVFTDEADEDHKYVYLVKEGADPEKHDVRVGRKTDKTAEILDGLQEGDTILAKKPSE